MGRHEETPVERAITDAEDALSVLRNLVGAPHALEPDAPNPTDERRKLEEWNRISGKGQAA